MNDCGVGTSRQASAPRIRRTLYPEWFTWLDISLVVPNEITAARDQLANERNWLTWFRLSCTLMVLGFTVLLRFRLPSMDGDDDNEDDEWGSARTPIGYIFILIGLGSFFVGLG
ncbi:hypothetical protein DFQ28_000174, partial [Apophysomyces sp. BC1034]